MLDSTTTTTTTPSTRPCTSTTSTVRHAGRASVRGKIRRVWRPRYLELLDCGHVKYYELGEEVHEESKNNYHSNNSNSNNAWEEDLSLSTQGSTRSALRSVPTSNTTPTPTPIPKLTYTTGTASINNTINNNSHARPRRAVYKYRLQIVQARILDGTTLRDLHVGLPRGAYGWVFRARRLILVTAAREQQAPAAAAAAATAQQTQSIWSPDPLKEERDFYCAVPALETAQMWVVALQWAAATSTTSWTPTMTTNQNTHTQTLEDDWEHASVTSLPSTNTSTTYTPTASASALQQRNSNLKPIKTIKSGTTVVTKVTGWQVVRTATNTWELAYQVQVLSCRHSNNNNKRTTSAWMVLRTAPDIARLVRVLRQDVVTPLFPVTMPVLGKTTDYANVWTWLDWFLQKLVTDATWLNTSVVKQFLGLTTTTTATDTTTTTMSNNDDKTRNNVPDTWYVAFYQDIVQPLLQVHDKSKIYPQPVVSKTATRTAQSLSSSSSAAAAAALSTKPESIVKEWLATRPVPHAPATWTRALLWCCHQTTATTTTGMLRCKSGWWTVAAVGAGAAVWWCWGRNGHGAAAPRDDDVFIPYAAVLTSTTTSRGGGFFVVPRVVVRLDVLVVSWVGAACLGKWVWGSTATTTKSISPTSNATKVQQRHRRRRGRGRDTALVDMDGVDENDDEAMSSLGTAIDDLMDDDSFGEAGSGAVDDQDAQAMMPLGEILSSPLPQYPANNGESCWSQPASNIFYVRSQTYLQDRVKEPSGPAPLTCRGVDVWMTDTPERHIARHPAVLGGKLSDEDTFLVNFLLPFGNFVAYFGIPPLAEFPPKLRNVWTNFLAGDQQYRDARLKLLPVVVEGPWIVKAAVGPGKSPALLGKVIPLQYFFDQGNAQRKAVYEVDVIITASTIAKGILSVVKGHTKSVSIAFAFIIEAAQESDLPETVLCTFQVHSLHLEDCPILPPMPEGDAHCFSE